MTHTDKCRRCRYGWLAVLLTVALISCQKDLDEVNVDDWRPILAVPIAHASFGVNDVLTELDSTVVPFGNQGQYALTYSQEVFSLDLDSILTLEQQEISLGHTLSVSDASVVESGSVVAFPVTLEYSLETEPAGIRVDEALLLSGTLNMDVDFVTEEFLTATVVIPQLQDPAGNPYTLDVDASLGDLDENVNLAGYRILPDHPDDPYDNQVTVVADVLIENNPDYVSQPGDGFDVLVTLTGLEFQHVIGDFGSLEIAVETDSIEVTVIGDAFEVDDFRFDQIYVDLKVTNSFGVPALLDLGDVVSENLDTGELINLEVDEAFLLAGQASLTSGPEEVLYTLDHTNSNLLDLIIPAPQLARFSGQATANPEGPPPSEAPNFVTNQSSIDVGVELTLPLAGYIQNLNVLDTIATSLDLGTIDNVDSVEFRLYTANTFPFGGEVQVVFLDTNFQALDSLFTAPEFLIAPALVDAGGFPNTSASVEHFVTLDQERVDVIRDTGHFVIRGIMNTTDSGSETVVTFDESAAIEVKLGAKIYVRAEL